MQEVKACLQLMMEVLWKCVKGCQPEMQDASIAGLLAFITRLHMVSTFGRSTLCVFLKPSCYDVITTCHIMITLP